MRDAATVLDVIRLQRQAGLPLERLYRQLFNPQLFLLACGRIYANKGSMTPGVALAGRASNAVEPGWAAPVWPMPWRRAR
jgi:hypothetical protein